MPITYSCIHFYIKSQFIVHCSAPELSPTLLLSLQERQWDAVESPEMLLSGRYSYTFECTVYDQITAIYWEVETYCHYKIINVNNELKLNKINWS